MSNAIQFPKGDSLPEPEVQQTRQSGQKIILDERGMIDMPFLLLTVLLVLIGVIMMFSASYASAYATENSSTYYFARQGMFALLGIGAMLFVSRLNYQLWRFLAFPILGVTMILMMATPIFGLTGGGATRWIRLGPLSFQPSEVAKLAVILSFAAMISQYKDRMQTFRGLIPFAGILGLLVLTLIFQRHLSGIVIICAVAAAMLFLGGVQIRWFALGLAAVAEPLVLLILTEKWLPCVPFMQLCCLAMVLDPLHSCNLQAVNAMGRSDLFLKLEVIKTIIDIPFFLIAIFCFETPLAIAAYGTISSWVCLIVNSWPNKKLINYSGWEQLKDVFPTMMLSLCMFIAVAVVGTFCAKAVLPDMVTLIVQVAVGIAVYVVASVVFKPYPFRMALEILKKRHHKDDED